MKAISLENWFNNKQEKLESKKDELSKIARRNSVFTTLLGFYCINKLNYKRPVHYGLLLLMAYEVNFFFFRRYDRGVREYLQKNSAGVPFFNEKKNLVDLEKTYFFLDDDNNYKPSLWYHGRVNNFVKPDGLL